MNTRNKGKNMEHRRNSTELPARQMDVMGKIFEEIKNMKAQMTRMEQDFKEEIKIEIRNEIRQEMKEVKQTIMKITTETNQLKEKVQEMDLRFQNLEREKEIEMDKVALMEMREKEYCVRLRGIPEEKGEILRTKVTGMLAEYMEIETIDLDLELDRIYRINSKIATQKNLPRDVIIHCVRKYIRDQIIEKSYKERMQIDGKNIMIMKEIPMKILRKRKDYEFLTDRLRLKGVRYRWEKIEGLSFTYNQKRWKVDSIQKAKEVLMILTRRDGQEEREREERHNGQQTRERGKVENKNNIDLNQEEEASEEEEGETREGESKED